MNSLLLNETFAFPGSSISTLESRALLIKASGLFLKNCIDIYLSGQPRDPVKELIHLDFTQEQKNHSFFVLIYPDLSIRGIYKLSKFLYDMYTSDPFGAGVTRVALPTFS